ncbi:MAG TPA: hypothetical protein VGX23_16270 [Actinocrinis sp.]|nr:hypothetical protein [Actinocrinis sp.]
MTGSATATTTLWGVPVAYSQDVSRELLEYLPKTVLGRQYSRAMPNGDFAVAYDELVRYRGRLADMVKRVRP